MIRHIVAFGFKPEVAAETAAALLAGLEIFPARYPAMRGWVLGPNISARDTTMSHVFTVEFDDESDLECYLTERRARWKYRPRSVLVAPTACNTPG